jgi:anti-sigma B factor antagonist
MANELQATLRPLPPLTVIDLQGEVTTFDDEAISDAYQQACSAGAENILFNFSAVDYMNSACISIIIGVLTEARKADQRLLLTGLTPHYRTIFQMMGLTQYAPLYDSEDAARQAFEA